MKNYLSFIAFAMMAVFSLSFTACSSDDDDNSSSESNQIEINGTKYSVSEDGLMGDWIEAYEGIGITTFYIHVPISGKFFGSYIFTCTSSHSPKVGDDFSTMEDFEVTRDFGENEVEMADYTYSSGSAKVLSLDKANMLIIIQFNNLIMVYEGHTYTFNGTVKLPFNYDN